jgi:FkbM family methyltransferase
VTTESSVRTGDDYCEELAIDRINFVKIDVEGWERFTLEGFRTNKLWGVKSPRDGCRRNISQPCYV